MTVGALPLTSLPPEILLDISEQMGAHDLIRLSRTCRVLSHFGGCKSIAKAFMRNGTAADAIEYLRGVKVNRMDLVVELFRRVEEVDRSATYETVAYTAARLNDLEQLEAWRIEFGFIPGSSILSAARSDRYEAFDYLSSRADVFDEIVEYMFEVIGAEGNRTFLAHLWQQHPASISSDRLEFALEHAVDNARLDFAIEIFESIDLIPKRCGTTIIDCAFYIANGAANAGNIAVFAEFIDRFEFDTNRRNKIAASAAAHNRLDILRLQEESKNVAVSFDEALERAVDNNVLEVVQYLLASDDFVMNRFESFSLVDALRMAIEYRRTEMLPLLLARAHPIALLHDAAKSESLDEAKLLLRGYGISDQVRVENEDWDVEFDPYTADVPDWKMAIWLIIIGLDYNARLMKSDIDDPERARFKIVLPAAIDLVRELNLDNDGTIDEMTRLTNGALEYTTVNK